MILSCPNCAAKYEVAAQLIPANGRNLRCKRCHHTWHFRVPLSVADAESAHITCSCCSATYAIPLNKIPPSGRVVRCGKCGQQWHQARPAHDSPPPLRPAHLTVPCPQCAARYSVIAHEIPSTGRWLRCSRCTYQWHFQQRAIPQQAISTSDPSATWAKEQRATERKKAPPRWGLWYLIASLSICGILTASLIWTDHAPPLSQLQNSEQPQSELPILENVSYSREPAYGLGTVLTVRGIIANRSNRTVAVPETLQVTMSDGNSKELFRTEVRPTVRRLAAGEALPFQTQIYNVPDNAVHLQVHLGKNTRTQD